MPDLRPAADVSGVRDEPMSVALILEAQRQWEAQEAVRQKAEIELLRRERDEALQLADRLVANESNHYDRYWAPPPERITEEWLTESEAKWREALGDVFCDDAAACFLILAQETRRAWAELETLRGTFGAHDSGNVRD